MLQAGSVACMLMLRRCQKLVLLQLHTMGCNGLQWDASAVLVVVQQATIMVCESGGVSVCMHRLTPCTPTHMHTGLQQLSSNDESC